jgi:hypothetical protein
MDLGWREFVVLQRHGDGPVGKRGRREGCEEEGDTRDHFVLLG